MGKTIFDATTAIEASLLMEDSVIQNGLSEIKETRNIFAESEVREILSFYKKEHIYLKKVEIIDGIFNFTFKEFEYPYFYNRVKHLTREQTMLFLTQASYFWGIVNHSKDNVLDYSKVKCYEYIKNEKIAFTHLEINYKKFTKNKDNIRLIFTSVKYRKFKGKIFGEFMFDLEKYCTGTLRFFMEK